MLHDLLFWTTVVSATQSALAIVASAHAVMWRREPRAALLWVVITWIVPFAGPLSYFVFGVNRTARHARKRMRRSALHEFHTHTESCARAGALEPLVHLGDRVGVEPLELGNLVEPLFNGEEAYPAMLESIRAAKKSVSLCSYIFDCDGIGKQFVDALTEAEGRGVEVRLLVDALGALGYASRLARLLRKRRLRAASFAPLGFIPSRLLHLNLRNHRKILVADGSTGFTGGMNVSERHYLGSSGGRNCRDLHFRIRGPAVAHLQRAFAEDWRFATGEDLKSEAWFPKLAAAGDAMARGVTGGPDDNLDRIRWVFHGAFQCARRSIRIVTPYFIPESPIRAAIAGAALRGVDVRLVLPSISDNVLVQWASTAYLWEFLQHGVRVARSQPPFDHTKLAIVDEMYVLFGSANLDPRSLRLNFEFNAEAYDEPLAKKLAGHVDELFEKGKKVSLKEVDGRSAPIRLRDGVAKLFSPYL